MATKTRKATSRTYQFERDGKPCELGRVTKIMEKVTGDAKGGMSYWGSQNAIQWAFEEFSEVVSDSYGPEWEDWYTAYKSSPFDNNKTMRSRGKEGTAAHKLFEQLLLGEAVIVEAPAIDDVIHVCVGNDVPFTPVSYDLAVVRAYQDIFQHLAPGEIQSERKVTWFEPGHPGDCPDDICTHGYAGTTDFVVPSLSVGGDLKTHKGDARFTDFLQNAFYAKAIKQEDGTAFDHFLILLAREDGTYDDAHGFVPEEAVDACYALWRVMEGGWLQ